MPTKLGLFSFLSKIFHEKMYSEAKKSEKK